MPPQSPPNWLTKNICTTPRSCSILWYLVPKTSSKTRISNYAIFLVYSWSSWSSMISYDFHWFPHLGTSQAKQSPTSSPWRVGVPPKRPNAPKLCGWSSWRSQSRNERRGMAWPGPSGWLESGLLEMSWIWVGYHNNDGLQWWPKDGLRMASSYCRILFFVAVPEVLNGFLGLLQRSLEMVWNCFEHVWRSLRRTSRVSRKQRLLTNFLWLHAFFHGTACYCFLWLLRNDARGSSQFSELVEMCYFITDSHW